MHLGKAEPLAHAAREGGDALVRDIGEPHPRERVGDAPCVARRAERPISLAV